ncbi:regulatory protein RecX [Anaerococcus sp. AGMB00486]|uniref:Regulatory protein RecX n=2 Tax=Anaerococcus TaxID=165779 RepID=A0ABX2N8J5_9FIRM|nr:MULTISPECIES: regulatory protein RecX [Anaerococcus]MDY3006208.1 regulatory protein RecX [Anaerococcus porci]MSS77180.1 regulatory protein RecX [Anaerococcus porci]NVF11015.1 regulatory protein RecX [Anaerococcus faecalis]
MILENIDYSEKENIIKLTISNEIFYLSYEFYNNLDINIGDEVDFNLYKKILNENDYNRCKSYALKQISYSNNTSFDLRNKMYRKGFSDDNISKVIKFLKSFNFIDDDYYVRSFVNDKSKISSWSKAKIRFRLKAKHIDDKLIDKYLDKITYKDEYEKANFLAQKRFDLGHDKDKVFRFLANRAFSYDIIKNVLEDLYQ